MTEAHVIEWPEWLPATWRHALRGVEAEAAMLSEDDNRDLREASQALLGYLDCLCGSLSDEEPSLETLAMTSFAAGRARARLAVILMAVEQRETAGTEVAHA